ncbi:MAG: hypothetical protein ACFBSF_17950 [Leptolyngbyaceae cyanobacterium]
MSRFEASESRTIWSKIRNPKGKVGKLLYATAPVWGRPLSVFRPGNVAMFHMGRCGSSVLGDLLSQHPKIYWGGEIYTSRIRGWRSQKRLNNSGGKLALEPDPLKLLQRKMLVAGANYYGCEVKFHHLSEGNIDIADYIDYLNRRNFLYITLVRKNFLRSIVSNTIMFSSLKAKTHNRSDEKAKLTEVKLDVKRTRYNGYEKTLFEHLEIHQRNFRDFEKRLPAQNVLKLTYEDDISHDPRNAYQKVCKFLGVQYKDLPIRLSKTNPFPLSKILVNYEEVKDYLINTDFAWMCE